MELRPGKLLFFQHAVRATVVGDCPEAWKVSHSDIYLNNIMYWKEDGKIYGVLSDYDLSLFFRKPRQGRNMKQRTGTRPYMAIHLLQPSPHRTLISSRSSVALLRYRRSYVSIPRRQRNCKPTPSGMVLLGTDRVVSCKVGSTTLYPPPSIQIIGAYWYL